MYCCPHHATGLTETMARNLFIWRCGTCSGLWLPSGVFKAGVGHVTVAGRGRPAGLLCPHDAGQLTAVIHRGVEIDVCGSCGGIWFDRGELEKIVAQSSNPPMRLSGSGGGSTGTRVAEVAVDTLISADPGWIVSEVLEFIGGLFSI